MKSLSHPRILYVDDEPANLTIFRSTFRREFEVLTATSGKEGLEIIRREKELSVILSDQRMPGMSGVEMLTQARILSPHAIRMILTAYTDVNDIIASINQGHIYHFITKPWAAEELRVTLKRATEAYRLQVTNQRLTEELIRAEKLAGIGKMASAMGHEIRNHLSFGMAAELIQERYPGDEAVRKYTRMILDAREQILRLLDDIRNFARQDRNALYQRSRRNLRATVEHLLDSLHLDQEFQPIQVILEGGDCGAVECDHARIAQVLLNLLRNAAQATSASGSIHLRVYSEREEAVIEVEDSGCGIAPEHLDQIWEPFFSTKGDQGMGLGLDICRKIIEDHGGSIQCRSRLGQGTTFTVRLPRTPLETREVSAEPSPSGKGVVSD